MKKGNNLAGIKSSKGYHAIWLYPIGLEVFMNKQLEMFEISFIFHPISFCFTVRDNFTLFK